MSDIIIYTKRLVGMDSDATSPWNDNEIQNVLDLSRIHFEWVLLDHDPDYRHYYCRASRGTVPLTGAYKNTEVSIPDFASYSRVGFIEGDYVLRDDRDEDGNQHTPNLANLQDGTFTFSTVPNVDLYIYGKAYNPYSAAAQMLMETPDQGRQALQSFSRIGVSETYATETKIKQYYAVARRLNRPVTRIHRG